MLITKQKIPQDFDMNINIKNHVISKVMNVKYLGYVLSTMGVSKESIRKLIDSLLTPIVESKCLNRDMCKFE